jgi:hypothetical protein
LRRICRLLTQSGHRLQHGSEGNFDVGEAAATEISSAIVPLRTP